MTATPLKPSIHAGLRGLKAFCQWLEAALSYINNYADISFPIAFTNKFLLMINSNWDGGINVTSLVNEWEVPFSYFIQQWGHGPGSSKCRIVGSNKDGNHQMGTFELLLLGY